MDKKEVAGLVDAGAEEILEISHKIWGFAELSLKEKQSAALYVEHLTEAEFEVTTGQAVSARLSPGNTCPETASRSSASWGNSTPCRDCPRKPVP